MRLTIDSVIFYDKYLQTAYNIAGMITTKQEGICAKN